MHGYVRKLAVAAAGLLVAVTTLGEPSAGAADEDDTCKGRTVTLAGTEDDDELTGTPGDDVIRAYTGDDVIDGRGGDDVLCGDSGADELYGGAGDDALHGGPYKLYSDEGSNAAEGDVLSGGSGNDRIFGGGRSSNEAIHISPAHHTPDRVEFPEARGGITVTENGVVTGSGIGRDLVFDVPHVVGTDWPDDITVRGHAIVSAGGGNDRVAAVAGGPDESLYPTLLGEDGDDRLDASRSNTPGYWLDGGEGTDTLIGSRYDDSIGDHDDDGVVTAGGGDDRVDVTSQMTVSGGSGADAIQVALEAGRRGALGGGPGYDHAELQNGTSAPLTIDVPGEVVRADGKSSPLAGIEDFGASAREADVRFIGGPGDERFGVVTWGGHTVRASMGEGDDYFAAYATVDADDNGSAAAWGGPGDDVFDGGEGDDSLFGDSGDDLMFGDSGNDALRGGPGDDRAYGTRGEADSCRAEVAEECEQ
ncbi:calcium-binding protein [Solicola gregarius]|uniref:Calcium-binding protein n=1 Tax=Solicola gregarius TaxID=2908642 RepID=A0AA46TDP8_9ACTN|nr:hypothetical protein [Solicola gregarius]UYM03384.1 hypothetical protein L0C25_12530 [Solicola gregarius]